MKNKYYELIKEHQKEVNNFPMFFAFDGSQFEKGMKEIGLTIEDKDSVIQTNYGAIIKKDDYDSYINMFKRHDEEKKAGIKNDKTGEGFIKDMFYYEMANHEYGYTGEVYETLDALNLKIVDVKNDPLLYKGFKLAEDKIFGRQEDEMEL